MDNSRQNGKNDYEKACSGAAHRRLQDDQTTGLDTEKQVLNNQPVDMNETDDALSDDDLEEIVGGLTTVVVPLCENCQKRIAVHQMTLCAACFLKLK